MWTWGPKTVADWMKKFEKARAKGDLEAAMASLDGALSVDPRCEEALGIKGTILGELGMPQHALAVFEAICAVHPDRSSAHYSRGLQLQALGRRSEAIAAYGRAIAIDPTETDARVNRGALLDDEGDPVAAIADYDRALALGDDGRVTHKNRGNSLVALERFEEALESYEKALALEPGDPVAQHGRSTALMSLGRLADADAARPVGTAFDLGAVRELSAGSVVLRYYPRKHTHPEALQKLAEGVLADCALRAAEGGLWDGMRIQVGWSVLTVRQRGGRSVLCEADFERHPDTRVRHHVTFSLQALFLSQLLHQMVRVVAAPCSSTDLVSVSRASLAAQALELTRKTEAKDGVSGWVVGRASNDLEPMTMGRLVGHHPHLVKVFCLPVGFTARFEASDIVSVRDAQGTERLGPGGSLRQ